MVWCVVSGCENRSGKGRGNPGILNRPQKKFFSFPSDPKRVKVWLAALREMDKLDSPDQHFICEDHFLPQDVSAVGVNSDAIPIMPPCLDGPMDMISSWAAESSEEEEDEWQTEGYDNVYEGGISFPLPRLPAVNPPPAINPPTQDPDTKKTSETKNPSSVKSPSQKERVRPGKPLATQILELLRAAPDGILDLNRTMLTLETSSFRVWEITCVLQGINLVEKMPRNRIRWIGGDLSSSSLNQQHFQAEVENLKATEENLDRLIRSCSEQLFDLTDDKDNAALAYVTPEDLCRIEAFRQQEVMVVKAPDGTSLKIPAPTEDSIQLHFKGRKGPIQLLTCDIRTGDSAAEESGRFLTVEESQIKSSALHKDSEDSSLLVLQSGNPRQPVELPLSNEEESNQHEGSWRRETPEQDAEDQTIQGEDRPFLEGTFITVFKEEPFDPELKEREPTSSQEEKAPYEEEPSDPEPQTEKTELCGGTCEAKTEVSAAPYTPQEEEFQAPYKEEPSDPEPQKEEKELCGGTSEVKTDVSTAPYKPQDEKFQALYKEEPSDPEPQKEEKGVESTDNGPDSAQRGDGGSFDEDDTHNPATCSDRSNWDEDAEPPADDTAASSPERTNPEPQPVNCTELEDEDSTNSAELSIDGDALTDSVPGSDHESTTSQTRNLTTTKSSFTEGATIKIVLARMESSCTQKKYCYVCKTPQSKIAHHLRNHEKKEPDIARASALPKHSKERKLLFEKLRNRGNFEHNKEAMINRAGLVKIGRRPGRSNIALNSKMYVHCTYCKAMLMRKLLGHHLTRCPSRTGSETEAAVQPEPEAAVQPEPESTYSRPISPAVLKILGNCRDEVASVARNDFLLLLLTQSLLDKHGGDPSKFEYIRQKVQEMSRLLLNLRRKYSISSFEDALKPENSPKVIEAVKEIAGYDEEKQTCRTPSLALKLGLSLRKMGAIIFRGAGNARNGKTVKEAKQFTRLCAKELTGPFSLTAPPATSGKPTLKLKTATILFTKDVQLMHRYLERRSADATEKLKREKDRDVYRLPEATTELANISKLAKENGFQEKSPDEFEDEVYPELDESDLGEGDEEESDGAIGPNMAIKKRKQSTEDEAKSSNRKRKKTESTEDGEKRSKAVESRRSVKKKAWNKTEISAVLKHFQEHILKGYLATKLECETCKNAEEPALSKRTVQDIRDFVRNRGLCLK